MQEGRGKERYLFLRHPTAWAVWWRLFLVGEDSGSIFLCLILTSRTFGINEKARTLWRYVAVGSALGYMFREK